MNTKLKSLYWRLRSANTVSSALKQILAPEEVVRYQGSIEELARVKGFDPGALLIATANLLDLASLEGNFVPDPLIIRDLNISEEFLEANNALVFNHEGISVLLASDLNNDLRSLAKNAKLELCLGLESQIKSSWKNYKRFKVNPSDIDGKKLEDIFRNLILDAVGLGAEEIKIVISTGAYYFSADSGAFEGSLHPVISREAAKWMEGKTKVKLKLLPDKEVAFSITGERIHICWGNHLPCLMLVEDDELFATVLKSTLERNSYQVFIYNDAETAMQAIFESNFLPDIIISDLHLPGISGDKFLENLREHYPDLPFIVLTSDQDQLTEVNLVLKGATAYLKKDEDIRVVLAWCSRLLSKYAA